MTEILYLFEYRPELLLVVSYWSKRITHTSGVQSGVVACTCNLAT